MASWAGVPGCWAEAVVTVGQQRPAVKTQLLGSWKPRWGPIGLVCKIKGEEAGGQHGPSGAEPGVR